MLSNLFVLYLISQMGDPVEFEPDILARLSGQQATGICLFHPCLSA